MASSLARYLERSPFQYGDFRALFLSQSIGGISFVGESLIAGWLLLERTDSAFVVSCGVALRFIPNLLLGIPAGALTDRADRRMLLRAVNLSLAVLLFTAAVLQASGLLTVGVILMVTFTSGCIGVLGQAARTSYAVDIVGGEAIVSGTALLTLSGRLGAIGGALATGALLSEAGAATAYVTLAVTQLLTAYVLHWARAAGQAAPVARPAVGDGVREFLRELGRNRTLALLVALTAAVEFFGFSFLSVMPSLARDKLDTGPGGLGLLNAFGATGGMLAILLITLRGEVRQKGRAFLIVLLLFGTSIVLLGISPSFTLALAGIAAVNSLAALSDLLSQSLIQSAVHNDLRGRAMGSWLLAIGLGPAGHLQMGALAAYAGVTAALVANGLGLVLVAVVALLVGKSIRRA